MKLNNVVYPLMLALAVTLAGTGCKHSPTKITNLPGSNGGMVGNNENPNTLPNTNPINPDQNPYAKNNNPIPLPNIDEINGMIPDRQALAGDTIHFAFDSAVIRTSEKSKLTIVAEALKADPATKLMIEGNCDERGTEEYNRSLGERRALAAREALAKIGVDPMRIFTKSYGKDKPASDGHDEASWAQNRRDDFVLLHPKAGS